MWVVAALEVHPAVAAVVLEACPEAAAPTVPPTWEGEVAVVALEDQGAAPPLYAALAPDPPASLSHPHASPSLSTTTTPRALRDPTDQQVCGHPATLSPLSLSPLTPTQTPPQMESF